MSERRKPVLAAWLHKKPLQRKGKKHSIYLLGSPWKKRWVELFPLEVLWHEAQGAPPMGQIGLAGCTVELRVVSGTQCLRLCNNVGEVLLLQSASESVTEAWKDALVRLIGRAALEGGGGVSPGHESERNDPALAAALLASRQEAEAQQPERLSTAQPFDYDGVEACLRALSQRQHEPDEQDQRASLAEITELSEVYDHHDAAAIAASVQAEIDADELARLRLEEMGFTPEQVDRALMLTGSDFEQGLAYLCDSASPRVSHSVEGATATLASMSVGGSVDSEGLRDELDALRGADRSSAT